MGHRVSAAPVVRGRSYREGGPVIAVRGLLLQGCEAPAGGALLEGEGPAGLVAKHGPLHVAAVLDRAGLLEQGLDEGGAAAPVVTQASGQLVADEGLVVAEVRAADRREQRPDRLGGGGTVGEAGEASDDLVFAGDLGPGEDAAAASRMAAGSSSPGCRA